MNPWLIRVGCAAAANVITLGIAAALFDKVEINAVTFIVAVVIFTLAAVLLKPLIERAAGEYASAPWPTTSSMTSSSPRSAVG